MVQLSYKQTYVDTVWSSDQEANDKWFGGIVKQGDHLYFHGGSGPGFHEGEAGSWFEKQSLFKYYNIQHSVDYKNYQILDAIIGEALPYKNKLSDSKNHSQGIGNKIYTNTSVAGYEQYSNHGVNCVIHVDKEFTKNTGTTGQLNQVFNYINSSYITNIKRSVIPYGGNSYISR